MECGLYRVYLLRARVLGRMTHDSTVSKTQDPVLARGDMGFCRRLIGQPDRLHRRETSQAYEADRRRLLGVEAEQPHRIKYKRLR